jgi:hypothetical protein
MILDLSCFFAGLTPLIRLRRALASMFENSLGSNRVRRRFAADTRMKNADSLDVVASPVDHDPARGDLLE